MVSTESPRTLSASSATSVTVVWPTLDRQEGQTTPGPEGRGPKGRRGRGGGGRGCGHAGHAGQWVMQVTQRSDPGLGRPSKVSLACGLFMTSPRTRGSGFHSSAFTRHIIPTPHSSNLSPASPHLLALSSADVRRLVMAMPSALGTPARPAHRTIPHSPNCHCPAADVNEHEVPCRGTVFAGRARVTQTGGGSGAEDRGRTGTA
jgi:hypothetical protein